MQRWISLVLAACVAALWLGCAHETTTKTTTTTSACPESLGSEDCETTVEETVVTTEVDRCHGVLSCTFVAVGEVIALPFRIVGAALGGLF